MDEESKKIIAGICESIKAMQAEIQTLKNTHESEATHSDNNSQTASQNSDLLRSLSTLAVPRTSSQCLRLLVHPLKPPLMLN